MRKTYLYLCTGLLGGIFWSAGPAMAMTSQSLTISPSAVNLVINPGSTHKGSFELINDGTSSYDLHIYPLPYSVNGENYTPDYRALPNTPNIVNWLSLDRTSVNLSPAQSVNIGYTLAVPPHTLPGGYYGVVFAEVRLPGVTQGVIVNEQVGEVFYVQVAGPAKKTGKILTWQANWLQSSPISAVLRLENDGSTHFFANTTITISDILGNAKYTYNTQKVLLPQTVRRLNISWPGAPPIGLFKVGGSTTIFGVTKTLPTKYVLVMSKTAQTLMLAATILLTLVIGLRYTLLKSRRSKQGGTRK